MPNPNRIRNQYREINLDEVMQQIRYTRDPNTGEPVSNVIGSIWVQLTTEPVAELGQGGLLVGLDTKAFTRRAHDIQISDELHRRDGQRFTVQGIEKINRKFVLIQLGGIAN